MKKNKSMPALYGEKLSPEVRPAFNGLQTKGSIPPKSPEVNLNQPAPFEEIPIDRLIMIAELLR